MDSNISYSSLENKVELYFPASWKLNMAVFWPNKCKQRWWESLSGRVWRTTWSFPCALALCPDISSIWRTVVLKSACATSGSLAMPEDTIWLAWLSGLGVVSCIQWIEARSALNIIQRRGQPWLLPLWATKTYTAQISIMSLLRNSSLEIGRHE